MTVPPIQRSIDPSVSTDLGRTRTAHSGATGAAALVEPVTEQSATVNLDIARQLATLSREDGERIKFFKKLVEDGKYDFSGEAIAALFTSSLDDEVSMLQLEREYHEREQEKDEG